MAKAEAEYKLSADELSRMILAPLAGEKNIKRLLIVADGALQFVPFAALPIPNIKSQISDLKPQNKLKDNQDEKLKNKRRGALLDNFEIVSLPSKGKKAVST